MNAAANKPVVTHDKPLLIDRFLRVSNKVRRDSFLAAFELPLVEEDAAVEVALRIDRELLAVCRFIH